MIYLRCCLGVSRIGSSRKGHTVVLYAKDQTMVLVMEDQQEHDEWYLAIKKLMEEERKDEEHGEGFEEEDDGYCTLPAAHFYKQVRSVFFFFFSVTYNRYKTKKTEVKLILSLLSCRNRHFILCFDFWFLFLL